MKWNSIQQEAWKFYNNGIGKVPKAFFYAQAGNGRLMLTWQAGRGERHCPIRFSGRGFGNTLEIRIKREDARKLTFPGIIMKKLFSKL